MKNKNLFKINNIQSGTFINSHTSFAVGPKQSVQIQENRRKTSETMSATINVLISRSCPTVTSCGQLKTRHLSSVALKPPRVSGALSLKD